MGDAVPEMECRLFSMTEKDDIPVLYVDVASINSHISDQKKDLAFDLLEMITASELMAKASLDSGKPRYLLPARYSVYDILAADFPVYNNLKKIAEVPDAHVFRIKPDGAAYLAKAVENTDILPDLKKNRAESIEAWGDDVKRMLRLFRSRAEFREL